MSYIALIFGLLLFSSCAAVQHLDEALALKEYSDEKEAQQAAVAEYDRKFEELLSLARGGGSFREYRRKADFVARFGQPVLTQFLRTADGLSEERFLYRYSTKYFDGPKVYVFFHETGQLKRVEYEGPGG